MDQPDNSQIETPLKRMQHLTISETELSTKRQKMMSPDHEASPYEFVEPQDPSELCCDCLKIPKDCMESHCGHYYCKGVIDRLIADGNESFQCVGVDNDNENKKCSHFINIKDGITPSKAHRKAIQNKKVYCPNMDRGCAAVILVKKVEHHLKNDCMQQGVKCQSCNRIFERKNLKDHEQGCIAQICPYSKVGCSFVSGASDAQSSQLSAMHSTHSTAIHLALLYQALSILKEGKDFGAKKLADVMSSFTEKISGLEETQSLMSQPDKPKAEAMSIEELSRQFQAKRDELRVHLERYNNLIHEDFATDVAEKVFRQRKRTQYQHMLEEKKEEEMKDQLKEILELPILWHHGSSIWKVTNFSEWRTKAIKGEIKRGINGPPFFSHEYGYLLMPLLYPNGDGQGASTHLSIFIAVKKGPYDALLPWPLQGKLTISILSQKRVGREAVKHAFRTDVSALSYHRPQNDVNPATGIPKALDIDLLRQPSDFLVDDTLFLQFLVEAKLPDESME